MNKIFYLNKELYELKKGYKPDDFIVNLIEEYKTSYSNKELMQVLENSMKELSDMSLNNSLYGGLENHIENYKYILNETKKIILERSGLNEN